MRHRAELVVKDVVRQELDVEGFQWAGVFKPIAKVDDSFALAEPPAHDDWVPQAVQDKSRRREVNVALRRIKEAADEYLSPRGGKLPTQDVPLSAAQVGDMLADLLGGLEGPAPSRALHSGGRAKRTARPRVDVVGATYEPAPDFGWSRTTIDVQLASAPSTGAAVVDVSVRIGVDGGSWDDHEVIRIVGWADERSAAYDPHPQELSPGDIRQFVYEARSDLAIDVETKLVDN
jgi:hypothetical protein